MSQGTEEERRTRAKARAWWLAMSGLYASHSEIEAKLVAEGIADAARWLDDELRRSLDETCIEARNAANREVPS